jgi:uncharacterized membrane protein HdeD (DUF308 family)
MKYKIFILIIGLIIMFFFGTSALVLTILFILWIILNEFWYYLCAFLASGTEMQINCVSYATKLQNMFV